MSEIERRKGFIVSIAVFVIGVLCVTGFYQSEKKYARQQAQLNLYQKAAGYTARLESLIHANLMVARGLRAEILTNAGLNRQKIDQLVQHYLESDVQVRHVGIAPNLVVDYVYPVASNEEAIGLDYRTHEAQSEAVMLAIQAKEIVLAAPVELVQGGTALIARAPVFFNGAESSSLWGVISVVINSHTLFERAGIFELGADCALVIRSFLSEDLPPTLVLGDENVLDQEAIKLDIKLPLGRWELAIQPKADWQMSGTSSLRIWAVGLALSLLVSWIIFLLMRSKALVKSHVAELKVQANQDHLTGLPNRKHLSRYLQRITFADNGLVDAKSEPFCLLFIDLDNFKDINDSLGHNIGDQLLVYVSERLEQSIRPNDFLARLGGDEFVIVLRDISEPVQAELWTKNLIDLLSAPYAVKGNDLAVTVSVGLAFYPQDGADSTTLLQHADRAMYAAKESGKNTLHFFNFALRAQADKNVEIYHSLISALEKRQFELHYQPLLDLRTGQFNRCEALLRWHHPEKGWIAPLDFIPIAEKTGFIRPLGLWVLEQVCQDMVTMRQAGVNLEMAINRSTNEFRTEDTLKQWLPIVEKYDLSPQHFTLEITESLLMSDDHNYLEKIRYLKSLGFKIAIDDFGTGFSSINYLRHYPVDIVKIDKSFVANILSTAQDKALFDALVQIAKALELDLVIEGIEREEQLALTRSKDCEFVQGYLLAKPMPLPQLMKFVSTTPTYPGF